MNPRFDCETRGDNGGANELDWNEVRYILFSFTIDRPSAEGASGAICSERKHEIALENRDV